MRDLIKALQILLKYGNSNYPTNCEHDVLMICGIDPEIVSPEDRNELDKLGFFVSGGEHDLHFKSFKFGSA